MDHYYKMNETIDSFRIIHSLGEGRYGIAYLAEDAFGEKYVVKQYKKKMLKTTRDKLFYEEDILKSLSSDYFPRYITSFYAPSYDAEGYIMEYKAGSVFEDLILEDGWIFSRKEIYQITYDLLNIINYLQIRHIVHRDIRTPNVILTKTNKLVLIDFGLARYIDNYRYDKQMDYWYLGDFLLHLFYTRRQRYTNLQDRPWHQELGLTKAEKRFIKRLLGELPPYDAIEEIYDDLSQLSFK